MFSIPIMKNGMGKVLSSFLIRGRVSSHTDVFEKWSVCLVSAMDRRKESDNINC